LDSGRRNTVGALCFDNEREKEPIRIREKRERRRTQIKSEKIYLERKREKEEKDRRYFSIKIEEIMMSSTTNKIPEDETMNGKENLLIKNKNYLFS
jgi:hypothetical protein